MAIRLPRAAVAAAKVLGLAVGLGIAVRGDPVAGQEPPPVEVDATGRGAAVALTVEVAGIDVEVGQVLLALFDSAASFTDEPAFAVVLPLRGRTARWEVRVGRGTYAVAAVHDRDGNGALNKNLVGMPREPYGFSNGARGRFSAPSFEDAAVRVERPTTIVVEVR